jgi:hypothetical protein
MPHRLSVSAAIFLLTVSLAGQRILRADDPSNCKCPPSSAGCEKCSRCGQWYVVETDNFQACCCDSKATAQRLAETAETLRTRLQTKWLGDDAQKSWNPKCQLVLHPNLESYVCACGRGSEHTVGSSLVKANEGRISSRQIDLVGGRTDFLTAALPHELTHVILKDRFPSVTLPRWADEGMAMLADTEAKQGRHLRDLESAVASQSLFDTGSLVAIVNYPGASRMGTFNGQSVSLVKYLVDDQGPRRFVDFIERANELGYDAAVRECYHLHDLGQLDRLWRRQVCGSTVAKSGSSPAVLAAR